MPWSPDGHRQLPAGPLTGVEEAAALAELAAVADGRIDLLAEDAGLAIGFHDQGTDAAGASAFRLAVHGTVDVLESDAERRRALADAGFCP